MVLGVVSFYLFICLISYSSQDPGPFHLGGQNPVDNWGGGVGAWLADLLFNLFGKMAYLLLLLALAWGWRWVWPDRAEQAGASEENALTLSKVFAPIAGFVLAMVGACGLDNLYFQAGETVPYVSGGVLGDLTRVGLSPRFGVAGTTLLMLGMFVTGITLLTRLSWFNLMEALGAAGFAVWAWMGNTAQAWQEKFEGRQRREQRSEKVSALKNTIKRKKPPKITPKLDKPQPSKRADKDRQMTLLDPASSGELPALTLLDDVQGNAKGYSQKELAMMSELLVKKLKDFNIDVKVEEVQPGPVVTRFEIDLAPGVKASQVVGLARDLARALSVVSIRVVENIPGKPYLGIEIPNQTREVVQLLDVLSAEVYEKSRAPLTVALGKDIAGVPIVADIAKTPHLLVAGTTGSGKSVCINTLIMSIVYKNSPEDVRMIMIDPKMLELSVYQDIPHLLAPVVTDMKKAANALHWCIAEMDKRFQLMAALGVRNIGGYNKKIDEAEKAGETVPDPLFEFEAMGVDVDDIPEAPPLGKLPYIVVIVDELADLMMVTKKKIEEVIIRIAQRARAAGIHLVLATQRPSVDVVTGLIKANVPSRIAFQVSSRADSRTVLDQMGAEQLLGQGDMLFLPPGVGFPQRVHGAFVSDEEVKRVTAYLRKTGQPEYVDEITDGAGGEMGAGGEFGASGGEDEADELYDRAVFFVTKERKASISAVQRYLRVGYNRAARMIETMEEQGIVGPLEHGKREILAPAPPEV